MSFLRATAETAAALGVAQHGRLPWLALSNDVESSRPSLDYVPLPIVKLDSYLLCHQGSPPEILSAYQNEYTVVP